MNGMTDRVYAQEELFGLSAAGIRLEGGGSDPSDARRRSFDGTAKEAAFPLGGIGTGNVSLGSRGELRDWEIQNRPGKRNRLPNSFFAVWAKMEGGEPVARVLESRLTPPYSAANGYPPESAAGLPRLAGSRLIGEYPIARIVFEDDSLPVQIELTAYTPMIPGDVDDSAIPGAYLVYRATNAGDAPVDVTISGSLGNPVGLSCDGYGTLDYDGTGGHIHELRKDGDHTGLLLHSSKYGKHELRYGSIALATDAEDTTAKPVWFRGSWFDFLQEFWDDFAADGRLGDLGYSEPSNDGRMDSGSIGACARIAPGETKTFRFALAWHFPNRINGWNDRARITDPARAVARNAYALRFADAWEAANYLLQHRERLERDTFAFHDALFGSSLPAYVLDAASANLAALRSTTCFRLEDGLLLAFEGSLDTEGSCEGNCTHVWNYAQGAAFLYPSLEQGVRRTEFVEETEADGRMNFRAYKRFEYNWTWFDKDEAPPAADGQLGSVMRVYREWKISGDRSFLEELWPRIRRSLAFAARHWDPDGDGVLEGVQHVTYDIEFHGWNPLAGIMYLGALKAAAEMALALGDDEAAAAYDGLYTRGSFLLNEQLWNGEYYEQRIDNVNAFKYQHGTGCLSDQLFGQQLAHLYGLGYLLPPERVRGALGAVYAHNFRTDFSSHANCQRSYVFNDEKGLVLCSWPRGGRPKLPFIYSDEVWTGVEYQVAVGLIYEGLLEEGLTLVRTVWERHDGYRRNPWDEAECGYHYARSLASWGLLLSLGGFRFDMDRREIGFEPRLSAERFRTFWSVGAGWGIYEQTLGEDGVWLVELRVLAGDMEGVKVAACGTIGVIQGGTMTILVPAAVLELDDRKDVGQP